MKKRTMMLLLIGMFALGINAKGKGKKNKKSLVSRYAMTGQVVTQQQTPGGITRVGIVSPGVTATVQPTTSDQQFLQDQLLGMQTKEINELKNKIFAVKARNAENKKIIDQALSEIISGQVILYKK